MADQMWLFVPIQEEIREFIASMEGYPFREGQVLNASGISYQSLRAAQILKEITDKGIIGSPYQ
jgi:arylsulfatase